MDINGVVNERGGGIFLETTFTEMDSIFNRTKSALVEFMGILTPIIENAKDDHERLFWHHIYEEEEHRSDRLDILMPKIQSVLKNGADISKISLSLYTFYKTSVWRSLVFIIF